MNEIIIKQHTGLGDYLICNGLVRELSKQNKIILPVPEIYLESVTFMYRDNPNILCTNLDYLNSKDIFNKILTIGYDWSYHIKDFPNENFEEMFYRHAQVNFNHKRDSFFVQRDIIREETLLHSLLNFYEPYTVIHEYNDRNDVKIKKDYIKSKKIISIGVDVKSTNIFDYISLINNAEEVHVIESSLFCLIDLCQHITNNNLYCHRYAKQQVISAGSWMMPKPCKQWNIL